MSVGKFLVVVLSSKPFTISISNRDTVKMVLGSPIYKSAIFYCSKAASTTRARHSGVTKCNSASGVVERPYLAGS